MGCGGQPQQGAALIAVLWILVLLTVMVGSFTSVTRTEAQLAHHAVAKAQGRSAVEAALNQVLLDLLRPQGGRQFPDDGTEITWRFDGHEVLISVADVAGRVDLNTGSRELLAGVLMFGGVEEPELSKILDEIEDWRDADDATRLNGAEDDDYAAAGLPYGAKDAPFDSVGELQQLLSVSPQLVGKIKDALTVHSGQAGVSLKVVSADALRSVPGVDEGFVEQYLEGRAEAQRNGLDLPEAPQLPGHLSGGQGVAYIVKTTASRPDGTKTVLQATVMPGFVNNLPRIIEWREDGT